MAGRRKKKTMPQHVTKAQFDGAIATIREDIRDVIRYVKESFALQEERFERRFKAIDRRLDGIEHRLDGHDRRFDIIEERLDGADIKLDAIMEMLVTRKDMRNLVRALKKQGIKLNESEIFTF